MKLFISEKLWFLKVWTFKKCFSDRPATFKHYLVSMYTRDCPDQNSHRFLTIHKNIKKNQLELPQIARNSIVVSCDVSKNLPKGYQEGSVHHSNREWGRIYTTFNLAWRPSLGCIVWNHQKNKIYQKRKLKNEVDNRKDYPHYKEGRTSLSFQISPIGEYCVWGREEEFLWEVVVYGLCKEWSGVSVRTGWLYLTDLRHWKFLW